MRHDCCEVADYAVVPCPLCSFCILKRPQCLTCHTYKHTHTHSKLLLSFSAFFTPSRETAGKKMLLAHLYPLAPNHDFAELQCVCVCVCVHSLCQAWGASLCRYRLTLISGFVSLSFTLLISSSEATPDVPRESAPSGQVSCSSLTRVARCVLIM